LEAPSLDEALLPSRHTFQMMAKAAVAVYEAAVENNRPEK